MQRKLSIPFTVGGGVLDKVTDNVVDEVVVVVIAVVAVVGLVAVVESGTAITTPRNKYTGLRRHGGLSYTVTVSTFYTH